MKNPCHPGEIIREDVLAPLGLNLTLAAKLLGVTRRALSNMLNGRTSLTAEMTLRVEKALGPILNLEGHHAPRLLGVTATPGFNFAMIALR